MIRPGKDFAIVCMQCKPEKHIGAINLVANGKMTMTVDGDLIIECSACGQINRYEFK